jgi:hypothetical protein
MGVVHLFGESSRCKIGATPQTLLSFQKKKEGAEDIVDSRHISLIHGMAKIFSKMLASWLGPITNDLVSNA